MTSNPTLLSAREIAAQIRRKKVSPVEVARAHLDRIERLNPRLNAFVDYKPDVVLAQARAAEKAMLRSIKTNSARCMGCLFPSSLRLMWPDIGVRRVRGFGRDMLLPRMHRWWLGCAGLGR